MAERTARSPEIIATFEDKEGASYTIEQLQPADAAEVSWFGLANRKDIIESVERKPEMILDEDEARQMLGSGDYLVFGARNENGTLVALSTVAPIAAKTPFIGIVVDKRLRERGVGKSTIYEVVSFVFDNKEAVAIKAKIKATNLTSVLMFKKSGFQFVEETEDGSGEKVLIYELKRLETDT